VEAGPADLIYRQPLHPYSRMLLAAVPRPDPDLRRARPPMAPIDLPSPLHKPSGCVFRTRCSIARPSCAESVPTLEERDGRLVACPYSE
jgi:oligopeptide/dipeptide ABC transporter ATP-binding protein